MILLARLAAEFDLEELGLSRMYPLRFRKNFLIACFEPWFGVAFCLILSFVLLGEKGVSYDPEFLVGRCFRKIEGLAVAVTWPSPPQLSDDNSKAD